MIKYYRYNSTVSGSKRETSRLWFGDTTQASRVQLNVKCFQRSGFTDSSICTAKRNQIHFKATQPQKSVHTTHHHETISFLQQRKTTRVVPSIVFFLDRTKIRRWTNGEIFTLTLSLAFQKTLKFAIKSLIWNLFHFVPHKRDTTKTSTYVFWAVREQWKIFSLRLFTSIPNLQTSPPLAPGVYFLPVSKHFSRQRFFQFKAYAVWGRAL